MALLLHELARIPLLRGAAAAQQLRADTNYVGAVLSSMGIAPDALLSRFVELATDESGGAPLADAGCEAALRRSVARIRRLQSLPDGV